MRASILAMILVGLFACHKAPGPDGAYGAEPAAPMAAPTFSAVNHKGEPRSLEHLRGHPTVVWFFPAAGTPG